MQEEGERGGAQNEEQSGAGSCSEDKEKEADRCTCRLSGGSEDAAGDIRRAESGELTEVDRPTPEMSEGWLEISTIFAAYALCYLVSFLVRLSMFPPTAQLRA